MSIKLKIASVLIVLALGAVASPAVASADPPDMTYNSVTPDMTYNSVDPGMTYNSVDPDMTYNSCRAVLC